jgi:hypothetical protein
MEWKADNRVIVWYPGISKILKEENRVGAITLEYRWVGFM